MHESRWLLNRPAWRDLRVAPPWRAVLRPARGSRAARFVEDLVHRHAEPRGSASRLGMMLLRPQASLSLHPLIYAPRIHVAPLLRVTLLWSGPDAGPGVHSGPASDGVRDVSEPRERVRELGRQVLRLSFKRGASRPARRIPTRRIAPVLSEKAWIRRLFARGERSAPLIGIDGSAQASAAAVLRPTGVPRTVRRTAAPVQEGASAAAALPGRHTASWTPSVSSASSARRHRFPEGASRAITSPADLERLTDEVIRAVDRRIIAQRERMGKR